VLSAFLPFSQNLPVGPLFNALSRSLASSLPDTSNGGSGSGSGKWGVELQDLAMLLKFNNW
jgi:hypothetical protein